MSRRAKRNLRKRKLRAEALEVRRCLTASMGWDGPGQGGADLSYFIGAAPEGLDQLAFEGAIEQALNVWSDVIDVDFTETSQPNQRDSIDFTVGNIDGSGGTLAQAYLPDDVNPARIAGDIEFDSSESWEIGNAAGRNAFDIVQVAVHEIGHALGLDHLEESGSVLAPFISPTQQFSGLRASDVDAALEIYAAAPSATTSETDLPTADEPVLGDEPALGDEVATDTNGESDDDSIADDRQDTPENNQRWRPWRRHRWTGGVWSFFGGRALASPAQHNSVLPSDVTNDGIISGRDAIAVINSLINGNDQDNGSTMLVDANNDGVATAADALFVLNDLFNVTQGEAPKPGAFAEFESVAEAETISIGSDTIGIDVDTTPTTTADDTTDTGETDSPIGEPVETTESVDETVGSPLDDLGDDPIAVNPDVPTDEAPTDQDPPAEEDTPVAEPPVTTPLAEEDTPPSDDVAEDAPTDDAPFSEDAPVEDDTAEDDTAEDDTAGDTTAGDTTDDDTTVDPDIPSDPTGETENTEGDDADDETADDDHDMTDGDLHCPVGGVFLAGHRFGWLASGLFGLLDRNDDNELGQSEIGSAIWDLVQPIDADASGGVSIQEIEDYRSKNGFERLDDNEDGSITSDEVRERLWDRISTADANDDGAVTADELQAFRDSKVSPRFSRLDNNADGMVTSDEVSDHVWEYLVGQDANGGESITPDELPAVSRVQFRFGSFRLPFSFGRFGLRFR